MWQPSPRKAWDGPGTRLNPTEVPDAIDPGMASRKALHQQAHRCNMGVVPPKNLSTSSATSLVPPAPGSEPSAHHNRALRRYGSRLAGIRTPVQAGADAVSWIVGIIAFQFIRFDFAITDSEGNFSVVSLVAVAAVAAVLQIVAGLWVGLYRNHWRYGSIDEMGRVVASVAAVTVVMTAVDVVTNIRPVPDSVPLGGAVLALVGMAAIRFVWRVITDLSLRPDPGTARKVLVVGAGEAGEQLVMSMLRNPKSPYVPVGFIDDDPGKSRLAIRGVRVVGTTDDLAAWADQLGATAVAVAAPSAPPALLRTVADTGARCGFDVLMLPPLDEMLGETVDAASVRPVTEADLLGRSQVNTDVQAIAGYLTDKRVLVTGAGGSIGSELCRQISTFAPAELIMLDRDESALHAVQLSITGRAMLDDDSLVVADIRDRDRISELFADRKPQVVFHAAALKHLTLVERFPTEALKTNVVGTQNIIDASLATGVERFVNVSTDKAADPTSVLGYTKRIAERLTASAAGTDTNVYLSVRFGNVLGSRGSVLTAFRAQIDAGGPVTVTDPEVTRFFMTVEEAVQLLIQAGAVGSDGEALVLDMGEPVRINDVALRLIAEASTLNPAMRTVTIEYTGLRPGEKLHEDLFGIDETATASPHPAISRVEVPAVSFDDVATATVGRSDNELTAVLRQLGLGQAVSADD
jgi:FlaA1/EpsC-like NDP-sugar epimerase